ncbi:MAG: RIP metalloprotease RseP [Spirochaetaceae bacterium]|nr:MAG: RIP metalloprotease RseP [Spirochaetaceae bacterium]
MIINILIGLLGLGIVVFVHEAGHLLAAKAVGIDVETFSIGWGRKIAGFHYKGTEYQISIFPFGGFCKMKGEVLLQRAWDQGTDRIPHEAGAFFSARPWQRILVAVAGPLVNLLFAILVLSVIWGIGFSVQTFENRIVLAADYSEQSSQMPAAEAGLQTGDRIVAIDGHETASFRDIQQRVAQSAGRELTFTIARNDTQFEQPITPQLDRDTGAGLIGIYPWIDPVVASVSDGSPADIAGLQPGDRIVRAGGSATANSMQLLQIMQATGRPVPITVERNETTVETELVPGSREDGSLYVGIAFEAVEMPSPSLTPLQAVDRGTRETFRTLGLTIHSIGLLFQGVDLTQAVAGPIRITYFVGEVATAGLTTGVGDGVRAFFNFLSLVSIALFFMNLLPIPVLDGGQILLYTVEGLSRRPLHPKVVYRYQMIGTAIVLSLIVFAFLSDILFLTGR